MRFSILHAKRACIASVVGCILLTACAAPGNDPSLSAEENQLRASNARFTQTVGEGALTGAVIGGIAGALLDRRNRGAGAAMGAAAGGVLGGAAGYAVARNNAARSHSEADYNQAISEAQQEAASFQQSAASANTITQRALREIAVLDAKYRSQQISASQYRARTEKYQTDSQLIRDNATHAQSEAASLRSFASGAGSNRNAVLSSASSIANSGDTLQAQATQISQALSRVPQSGA